MKVIRQKPSLFASCTGSFLCCSPEAAKIVGVCGALILNNLICCAQEPNIGKIKDENNDAFYPLKSSLNVNDLSELFDSEMLDAMVANLEVENFIKTKIKDGEVYYKILYERKF